MSVGLPLMSTSYSFDPIFAVPDGRIRFCALIALTTSSGDKPFRLQRGRVQVDLHLPLLAAIRIRN